MTRRRRMRYLLLHHQGRTWRVPYDSIWWWYWLPETRVLEVTWEVPGRWGLLTITGVVDDATLRRHPDLLKDATMHRSGAFRVVFDELFEDPDAAPRFERVPDGR